jgi:ACR3 family arsenite transporter
MLAGVLAGRSAPSFTDALRRMEFGSGSQTNIPIAVLIWLMIIPMMMKVDFASIRQVGQRPRGLLVTLFVNWLVKPFSMAVLAWVSFRIFLAHWISPADADQYTAGRIMLAAAPCTAMVFVWSYLTDGDPAYTLVQVSVNDLIMLCGRDRSADLLHTSSRAGMVREAVAAAFRAGERGGAAGDADPDFRLSSR